MTFGRMLRRKARAAVAPAIFLALAAYFLWSARGGEHGLRADEARQATLRTAQAEQAQAAAALAAWERRVNALKTRIDGDALDERARAMLNLSDPQDVIVPYDRGQRLF
jgi:cell division protein FtsB